MGPSVHCQVGRHVLFGQGVSYPVIGGRGGRLDGGLDGGRITVVVNSRGEKEEPE